MALVGLLVLLNRCQIVFVSILAWYLVFVMNDKLDTFSYDSSHIDPYMFYCRIFLSL